MLKTLAIIENSQVIILMDWLIGMSCTPVSILLQVGPRHRTEHLKISNGSSALLYNQLSLIQAAPVHPPVPACTGAEIQA